MNHINIKKERGIKMDTQVLNFQKWLNKTYNYHAEWTGCPEDGRHGGDTIFSMIQALQAEIGYANLSGNFGDGTLANVPIMKISRPLDNFTIILKGSLWRAGYTGGGFGYTHRRINGSFY